MTFTPTALALVVGCSLGWAGLDLCRKLLAGRIGPLPLLFFLTLGTLPFALVWAIFEGSWRVEPGYLIPGLASAVLNVVANVAYLRSVQLSPLSATVPMLSLAPVFTTLLAVPMLGQVPTPLQGLGIVAVVLGALVLNHRWGEGSPLRSLVREPGAPLMMLVALLWSVTLPLDKMALDRSSPAVHTLILSALVAGAAFGLAGRGARSRPPRGTGRILGVTILVGSAALVLQMLAIEVLLVGLVETFKRGVGGAAAVVAGSWVLAEPVTAQKVTAVLLMAGGVALVLI